MGLEGTLRVFSLNDIFQVLGFQRKSGVLTVEGEEDTVAISFLGGQIVSADSSARRLEDRIGSLMVRAGRVSEEDLARVIEMQKQTHQRLGFLLIRERLVTPEDLRAALRLQILRIVFSAFRWTDGKFRFNQQSPIDYDTDHMAPVPTESVLMEAAQIQDEWPLLQKKISSTDAVFRRAPGVENLRLVTGTEDAGEGSLLVTRPEAETWRLIDGERSVAEIAERAFLSDFEVFKGTAGLLNRNLILEGRSPIETPAAPAARPASRLTGPVLLLWGLAAGLLALAAYLLPRNPWNPLLHSPGETRELAEFLKSVSLARLVRIERAVRVYYDSSGKYPRSLEDLVAAGILEREEIRDPYRRPYRYILRPDNGRFGLYGRNARGEIDLDLSIERSLAPVSELYPAPARLRQVDRRPGVQVIE